MKAKEYFQLEAGKTVLGIIVLFIVANFVASGQESKLLWDVVILIAVADFLTVLVTYVIYQNR